MPKLPVRNFWFCRIKTSEAHRRGEERRGEEGIDGHRQPDESPRATRDDAPKRGERLTDEPRANAEQDRPVRVGTASDRDGCRGQSSRSRGRVSPYEKLRGRRPGHAEQLGQPAGGDEGERDGHTRGQNGAHDHRRLSRRGEQTALAVHAVSLRRPGKLVDSLAGKRPAAAFGYNGAMATVPQRRSSEFGFLLREWRRRRGLSQLALATAVGTTPRHLSFLETGRSRPGAEMVLRLGRELGVPLREQNALLEAAGLRPVFNERPIEDDELARYRHVIESMLAGHEPLPAAVLDRYGAIRRTNAAFERLSPGLVGVSPEALVDLFFGPGPWREALVNWPEVAAGWLSRQRAEGRRTGDPRLQALIARAEQWIGPLALRPTGGDQRVVGRSADQRGVVRSADQRGVVRSADQRVVRRRRGASSCGLLISASSCGLLISAASCGLLISPASCGPLISPASCGLLISASSCGLLISAASCGLLISPSSGGPLISASSCGR